VSLLTWRDSSRKAAVAATYTVSEGITMRSTLNVGDGRGFSKAWGHHFGCYGVVTILDSGMT
jgi:hypothetical protein